MTGLLARIRREVRDERNYALNGDFGVCPHCWHFNGPLSRICIRCRADMTLRLQESGGERWTAAVQSPVPVAGGRPLSVIRRIVLFSMVVLFGVAQFLIAFAPPEPPAEAVAVPFTP